MPSLSHDKTDPKCWLRVLVLLLRPLCLLLAMLPIAAQAQPTPDASSDLLTTSFAEVVESVQPNMVKIFGAGGLESLESYQSGMLISAEGHVLTAMSYVLDTDYITVLLNDGRRYQAEMLGADPRLEVAVLKIDEQALAHFELNAAVSATVGARVLAFSNLFKIATGDEPVSVMRGVVMACTNLSARRGAYEIPYSGPVYVLDAMTNNPGAAGGALTDSQGRLIGMLGKELRNLQSNTWINYALPIAELQESCDKIIAGEILPRSLDQELARPDDPLSLDLLGLVLVPDVLRRTPPFVDRVVHGSAAEEAGIQPDDLVLFVDGRIVQSCDSVDQEVGLVHRHDPVEVTLLRGQDLIITTLRAPNRPPQGEDLTP